MSDFFGKLKSGAEKVAFEADKLNRLNRAKNELEKLKSQVQAHYAKLGELYFNQRNTMGVTGPAYDDICQAITDLDQQIEAKNADIQQISSETFGQQTPQPQAQPASSEVQPPATQAPAQPSAEYTPQPPPAPVAAVKFCPNCGKELPAGIKFCPDCGTKV